MSISRLFNRLRETTYIDSQYHEGFESPIEYYHALQVEHLFVL